MSVLSEDLEQVRTILRANGCEGQVAEDVLVTLLELHAGDQRPIDLVVMDLETILGKTLRNVAQQTRWQELQRASKGSDNDIEMVYENICVKYDILKDGESLRRSQDNFSGRCLNGVHSAKETFPNETHLMRYENSSPRVEPSSKKTSGRIYPAGSVYHPSVPLSSNQLLVTLNEVTLEIFNKEALNKAKSVSEANAMASTSRKRPAPLDTEVGSEQEAGPSDPVIGRSQSNCNTLCKFPSRITLPTRVEQIIKNSSLALNPCLLSLDLTTTGNLRKVLLATRRKKPMEPSQILPSTSASNVPTCSFQGVPSQFPTTKSSNDLFLGTPTSFRDYVPAAPLNGFSRPTHSGRSLPNGQQSMKSSGADKEVSVGSRERRSIDNFRKIFTNFPDVHVHFAAYKASESALGTEEPLGDVLTPENFVQSSQSWTAPPFLSPEHETLYKRTVDHYFQEQLEFLVTAVPEADPDFLEEQLRATDGDSQKIRQLVNDLVDSGTYPSRADYDKRKEHEELAGHFFTVEEFLETYDDPFKHFYDETRPTNDGYRIEALEQLKADFRSTSVTSLRRVFEAHRFHYVPAHYELSRSPQLQVLKSKRTLTECRRPKVGDLELLREVAFVQHQEKIHAHLRKKEEQRSEALERARLDNALLDCPICCQDQLLEQDFVQCPTGHGICRDCLRRQTQEVIGQMKNHVRCLDPSCTAEYPLSVLKEVLSKTIFTRLEKRRQSEEVLAAGIQGLESCPFCQYCHVPDENDRLFQCMNPECRKTSCRQCGQSDHRPLRCHEYAAQVRLKTLVESKMTEALVRECPKCRRRFVKSDGCNKMVCPCGTILCYVCRQVIKDYSHFDARGAGVEPSTINGTAPKCPLFADTAKMHQEEVDRARDQTRAQFLARGPDPDGPAQPKGKRWLSP